MSGLRMWILPALIASTFWICGCVSTAPRTARIPATELPELLRQRRSEPPAWPEVRTVDGSTEQLIGPLQSLHIEAGKRSGSIRIPNAAQVSNGQLDIEFVPSIVAHSFPVSGVSAIAVNYENERKVNRNIAGWTLIGLATPGLVTGTYFLIQAGLQPDTNGIGQNIYTLIGAIALPVGLIPLVSGTYLLETDPEPNASDIARFLPTLHLLPGGASISTTF